MNSRINKVNLALATLAVLFIGSMNVSATPEVDEYSLRGKHIKFTINYRYYKKLEVLYYKCLLENLDGFIDSLKQCGRLKRGKVHFEIMTAVWMDHAEGVEMYRYKNGYYCFLNGLVQPITQDYLTKIIAYFASDNWESFCYKYYDPFKTARPMTGEMTSERALQVFNRRIDTITVSYKYRDKKLLELNNLALYFENGTIVGRGLGEEYGEIRYILPFSVGTKDFILKNDTLLVIENGAIINTAKLTEKVVRDPAFWCRAHSKWVNFSVSSDYILSYSAEKNIFYKL